MARLREDVRRLRFWRSIITEFIGTFFLVLLGCGSYTVSYPEHPLTVKVALAFGLAYAAILYCVRNVGDAHLNPSITIAMLITRRSSPISGLIYIVAQMLGALIGAGLVYALTASAYRQGGTRGGGGVGDQPVGGIHLPPEYWWPGGCTVPSEHTTEGQAFAVEMFATFFFVFVVFAAYDKTKAERLTPAAPFIVGLTYSAAILFSMPYSGGSMNTARSFGPAIVNRVWTAHWIYWFGPLLGAIIGGAFYDMVFSTKSSFSRIRTCLLVFHRHDDDPEVAAAAAAESAPSTTEKQQPEQPKQTRLASPESSYNVDLPTTTAY
jgi:aquaporin-4